MSWSQDQAAKLLGYKSINSFYSSKAWRELRALKLAEDPWCQVCAQEDIVKLAEEIDHRIPIIEAPYRALDLSNLDSLCKSHHSIKTAQDQAKNKAGGRILTKYPLPGTKK